ncbi:type II secretion protein [Halobacteriales archaeon QS_1_68_20]|nr:MAG: type II secretion protein [Halobacteriales archaeon QS_1_68_20]
MLGESALPGLDRFRSSADPDCACDPAFEGDDLVVDADDCPGRGVLSREPACRATVVEALETRDAETVRTRADGLERAYEGRAAALLVAAGRFVDRATFHDATLADRCRRDPLTAARDAVGRAGVVAEIAAKTGLAECASDVADYEDALRPFVAPTLTRSRVAARPPPDTRLVSRRDLPTGAAARIYEVDGRDLRTYFLDPVESALDREATRTLARAHERLATGGVEGGDRAPAGAVRQVASEDAPVERLSAVLRKHTRGLGVLADLFADDRVSDVYATAPVAENPLRVVVDGEAMRSNVRLTADGAETLASRFRRESGRAFSRASPTLDAVATAGDHRTVRVAGLTAPASDGVAFAFRVDDAGTWTLPALVANGTVPPAAAGLLSLAVERGAATLVAGPRGAGKTTTLAALLWELDAGTRVVCIEDTPELPVEALQTHGRDVQAVRTTTGEEAGLDAVGALRAALRLGEGALVLGEVRGEEAQVLYEAMRVGATANAVLGTVHGDGAAAVRERVVTDLGVPASSFAVTDLVVTLQRVETAEGPARRVVAVEEVLEADDGVAFAPLFAYEDGTLTPTGRVDRGESHLIDALSKPRESYADVRDALERRRDEMERLARADLTAPADLADVNPPVRGS